MSIRLTPPPERDFPAGRLQQRKEQLVSEISGATAATAPRRPRRILVSAAAFAVAGILTAAAYAGYALTRPVTPVATIGCYETDSLDANTAVLAAGTSSPVAACARTYASAFPGSQQPAHFAACVLPSGSVGVFPSETTGDTCKNLGLSASPTGTQRGASERNRLEEPELLRRAATTGRAPARARARAAAGSACARAARQAGEVGLEHLEHRRRVERGGRVVERIEEDAAAGDRQLLLLAVHARDPERPAGEELVAKLPSVAITFGSISSIWRKRCGSHASISSGCGSRLPGGRHLRTFAM